MRQVNFVFVVLTLFTLFMLFNIITNIIIQDDHRELVYKNITQTVIEKMDTEDEYKELTTVAHDWVKHIKKTHNKKECDQLTLYGTNKILKMVKTGKITAFEYNYEWTKRNYGFPGHDFQEESFGNTDEHPVLSIVVASRNDGYGGNSNERLARALQQFSHFNWSIPVEYVLVEWNYLKPYLVETEELSGVMNSNNTSDKFGIRFVRVPFMESMVPNLDGFACNMFEYWAKNVGMRRARGDWILITNIDDIFPLPLLNFLDTSLLENKFDANGFYTCTRSSMRSSVHGPYDTLMDVDSSCIVGNKRDSECQIEVSNRDVSYVGDFEMFQRHHLNKTGGFLEIFTNFAMDSEFLHRNIHINRLKGYIIHKCNYCHQKHTKLRQNN